MVNVGIAVVLGIVALWSAVQVPRHPRMRTTVALFAAAIPGQVALAVWAHLPWPVGGVVQLSSLLPAAAGVYRIGEVMNPAEEPDPKGPQP